MAINKNFVIKNGVEINTSLIVGDATLNKVGVGTTVPGYTLHVGGSRGGIGATDITITGIATVGTSGSTSAALSVVGVSSFQGDINFLGSAGVSTITFDASLDKLNFVDNARATFGTGDDLQIYHEGTYSYISNQTGDLRIDAKDGERGIVVIPDSSIELYYGNTKTFNTTPQGINVVGVTTSTRLNVAGISTLDGGVRVGTAASIYTNGNVAFSGLATANGGLQVGTAVSVYTNGNIAAAGIVTANGGLAVGVAATIQSNGAAAFVGVVTVGSDLHVGGDLFISEDLVLDTNLNILGIATLGNLHVTGIGTIDSDVRVGGASTFVEIAKFEDDLAVGVSTFFVDKSTGRIGIGTNAPSAALQVGAAAGTGIGVSIFENGNAAFSGIVTVGGDLKVTGDLEISEDLVINTNLNILGIASIRNLDNTGAGIGSLSVTGVSTFSGDLKVGLSTLFADVSTGRVGIGTSIPASTLDVDGALTVNSAKVEDLTNNRVVIVGTSGELEDDSNFTFDGAMLKVGTAATIAVNGNAAFAGIVTVGGNLNVIGDIVYDEITGRNLNITGISTQAGQVNFGTSGVGATVFANGNVTVSGIVTASSFVGGTVAGSTGTFTGDVSIADKIIHTGDTNTAIRFPAADTFTVETGGSEAIRVDSSQRLIVGSTQNVGGDQLQVNNAGGSNLGLSRFANNTGGPDLFLTKSRDTTPGDHTTVADGDVIGQIRFRGDDGTNYVEGCRLFAKVNGTVGTNSIPTDLAFGSGTTGAEKVRITSAGRVNTVGIVSATGGVQVAAAASINTNGNAAFVGVVTAGRGFNIGIQSAGIVVAKNVGISTLNFLGAGNSITYHAASNTLGIDIAGSSGGGGVSEVSTNVSSTSATGVGSFAVATHRSAAIIAQIDQGANYQVGRYLMIHDGTTATVIEESAIATGSMLGSFTADVNNSNAEFKVTMGSSGIATVTTKIDTVTV